MKLLIVFAVILTGSLFLAPRQKNIEGTWILDREGKKYEATVIRIQMREGYFVGTLDIPEQEVYDKRIAIKVDKDTMTIILDEKETCFMKVILADSMLVGTSVVCGETAPVRFYRAEHKE